MADMSPTGRQAAAKRGAAMAGGRYPIADRADLENAVKAASRAGGPNGTDEDRAAVRRFVIKRAKALNCMDCIPGNWASDGSLKS